MRQTIKREEKVFFVHNLPCPACGSYNLGGVMQYPGQIYCLNCGNKRFLKGEQMKKCRICKDPFQHFWYDGRIAPDTCGRCFIEQISGINSDYEQKEEG